MSQSVETTQHPSFDEPLAIGLTPSEIFDAVVEDFESGHTSNSSLIAGAEELVVWQHEVGLARTGSVCRIAVVEHHLPAAEDLDIEGSDDEGETVETDDEDFNDFDEIVVEYLVELEVAGVFVCALWEAMASNAAEVRHIKRAAHDTYIKMAALIGVRVGYELTANPTEY